MSALHVSTPLVKFFGNSVIFGDRFGLLPTIFQPYLFYPDWYFMAWPFEFIKCVLIGAAHPYFDGFGLAPPAFGMTFFILAILFNALKVSDTFTRMSEVNHYPIAMSWVEQMQAKGLGGQVLVLPAVIVNFVYFLIIKTICLLLFWHIIIARVGALFITLGGRVGVQLTSLIQTVFMIVMLVPPLAYMTFATFQLIVSLLF